jgi:hypothetical protein
LIIGEAAPPHDDQNPLYFRLVYHDVAEFQTYRRPVPKTVREWPLALGWKENTAFQSEEITDCGETTAVGSVSVDDDGESVLLEVPFRRPELALIRPLVPESEIRMCWITTWTSHLQAIYFGDAGLAELSADDARLEWIRQREVWAR